MIYMYFNIILEAAYWEGMKRLEADQAGFKSNCTFTHYGIFRQVTPIVWSLGPLSEDIRIWPLHTLHSESFSPRKRKRRCESIVKYKKLYISTIKNSMHLVVCLYCNILRTLSHPFTLPLPRQFPLLGILKSPWGGCLTSGWLQPPHSVRLEGPKSYLRHLVLEGWGFLSNSVWVGSLEHGKHTGATKRHFHPLPFALLALHEECRNCQHEVLTCST